LQPLFDSLSSVLETSAHAALTIVDRDGCSYTGSMRVVPSPFRGRLWLAAGNDETPIDKIGAGAEVEVSVACESETGPSVIICGWAVVLRNAHYAKTPALADLQRGRVPRHDRRLRVCVTARAAQMWETASALRPLVFAFSHPEPVFVEDCVGVHPLRAQPGHTRAEALEHAW